MYISIYIYIHIAFMLINTYTGMALCFSEPLPDDRAGRVEVSTAVFHGAIHELHIRGGLHHGTAHVLSGAVYMALPGESLWSQIFHCLRMVYEDGVPGSWDTSLAHLCLDCMLRALAIFGWPHWDQSRICICQVPGTAVLLRD